MNTNENKSIDDIDNITDHDNKGKGANMVRFLVMIVLLILLAKVLAWLLK